jgi:ABC-type sugar transport system substrate-binding protein
MPGEISEMKENFDNVYSIYIENQFAPSKLTIEEQSDVTETALETYPDFDLIIANDDIKTLKDKVFDYLKGLENG